jgi:hypothetical protein
MSVVAATRALEQIDEAEPHRRGVEPISPRVTINIVPAQPTPALPNPVTIEHSPAALEPAERRGADGFRCDEFGRPVFDPDRPHYLGHSGSKLR